MTKYGNDNAARTAAVPNAAPKPWRPMIHPMAVEPVPMPVSKHARIAPKAAPRRAALTLRMT
jgi:hypothetical protein